MRDFACTCSENSRAEAEGWAREAFPKLKEGKEKIGTGVFETKTFTPQVKQDDGTWAPGEPEEHSWEETREFSLTELALFALADLGDELKMSFSTEIVTDQWCALSVTGRPWESASDEDEEVYGCQFDYDALGHALCAVLLQIEDQHPEVKDFRTGEESNDEEQAGSIKE